MSQLAAPPPGEDRTSRAKPAHTNDIARVTTMSGHARADDDRAVDPAEHQTEDEHAGDDRDTGRVGLAVHRDAATTLVSAIIDPIDRSIPPLMTMTAWATAARASGRTDVPRPWTGIGP